MTKGVNSSGSDDHCRIGSLEKNNLQENQPGNDHCRIGSLEIFRRLSVELSLDHCRIGSLEKAGSG